ncbi:UPF0261 protein [Corchorus olitorius]|uniref:UPF0261 protein n=1 Tax=Corchorus olitorius TaxID=93759 RepID=A0A1R3G939_9ROSI|nr:UPF0261 protein [Corchorus olitorius]
MSISPAMTIHVIWTKGSYNTYINHSGGPPARLFTLLFASAFIRFSAGRTAQYVKGGVKPYRTL